MPCAPACCFSCALLVAFKTAAWLMLWILSIYYLGCDYIFFTCLICIYMSLWNWYDLTIRVTILRFLVLCPLPDPAQDLNSDYLGLGCPLMCRDRNK
jgi:hypothetical protein